MDVIVQIGVVFAVCFVGEIIAALLPFTFPSGVIAMVLLFLLLATKALRPHHLKEKSTFLLNNMPLFFIPACVGVMRYADVLLDNLLPIVLICVGTVPLVFFVTGQTVQLAMRWIDKREAKKHD
jgi:holin-like protein